MLQQFEFLVLCTGDARSVQNAFAHSDPEQMRKMLQQASQRRKRSLWQLIQKQKRKPNVPKPHPFLATSFGIFLACTFPSQGKHLPCMHRTTITLGFFHRFKYALHISIYFFDAQCVWKHLRQELLEQLLLQKSPHMLHPAHSL